MFAMLNFLWNQNLNLFINERNNLGETFVKNLSEIKVLSKKYSAETESIKHSNELKQAMIHTTNYVDEKLSFYRDLNKDPAHLVSIHKLQLENASTLDNLHDLMSRKIYHSPDRFSQKLKENIDVMKQVIDLNCHIVQKISTKSEEFNNFDDKNVVKRGDNFFPV